MESTAFSRPTAGHSAAPAAQRYRRSSFNGARQLAALEAPGRRRIVLLLTILIGSLTAALVAVAVVIANL
jgi:hypothetical protein